MIIRDIYFRIFRLTLKVENSISEGEGLIKKNKVGGGVGGGVFIYL